jgi:uncharacterized protein involved in exopolysaccharide biosynthesis
MLWRSRRLLLIGAALGLAVGVGVALVRPARYEARVSLLPVVDQAQSGVLGQLASLSGTSIRTPVNYEAVYREIVLSNTVLDGLAERKWRHVDHDGEADLFTIFAVDPAPGASDPVEARLDRLRGVLRGGVVAFARDQVNGFMEIRVTVPDDPAFAASLANALADGLEDFNRRVRFVRASDHRRYIETRLAVIADSLQVARDAVVDFERENRSYATSPELRARREDLQRDVNAQTALWVELKRQVELARIDENRNKSTLTVLDRAGIPAEPTGPGIPLFALVGLSLGFCGALVVLVLAALVGPLRERIRVGGGPAAGR